MMEGDIFSTKKKKATPNDLDFIDIVFSWSLQDIFNENLYKDQVEKIPKSFQSVEHYAKSYVFPLLEETRGELCSSMKIMSKAPFAEVIAFDESKPYGTQLYDVKVDHWKNRFNDRGNDPYRTLPGDIFVLADAKPETVSDLERAGRTWSFALVDKIQEDEDEDKDHCTSTYFKVRTSKDIKVKGGMRKPFFMIFLINITTNKRIWSALHMCGNLKIIKEVLCTHSLVNENCDLCLPNNDIWAKKFGTTLSSKLNESQMKTVLTCLPKIHCEHKSSVELIWGPPGTRKTKTLSSLLFPFIKGSMTKEGGPSKFFGKEGVVTSSLFQEIFDVMEESHSLAKIKEAIDIKKATSSLGAFYNPFDSQREDNEIQLSQDESVAQAGVSQDLPTKSPPSSQDELVFTCKDSDEEIDPWPRGFPSSEEEKKLTPVRGFKVPAWQVPFVEKVFEKYGEISAHCNVRRDKTRDLLMHDLIVTTRLLRLRSPNTISCREMSFVEDSLLDLERAEIDISWLKNCWNQFNSFRGYSIVFNNLKKLNTSYAALEEKVKELRAELEKEEKKLAKLGKRVQCKEEKLAALKEKAPEGFDAISIIDPNILS